MGDDGVHACERLRLARVEARDRGVVVRRAQRLRPERAANADVVDVLRPSGDVGDAVVARKSCADGFHAGLPGISTSASSGSKLGSTSSGWTSPLRGRLDRADDLDVAGAAADVAGERLEHVLASRLRSSVDERGGRHEEARTCRSRTARRSARRTRPARARGRPLRPRPSTVVIAHRRLRRAAARQDRRASPSTRTVQAPQPPCWQPALGLVMSSSSRSAVRSDVSGGLWRSCVLAVDRESHLPPPRSSSAR